MTRVTKFNMARSTIRSGGTTPASVEYQADEDTRIVFTCDDGYAVTPAEVAATKAGSLVQLDLVITRTRADAVDPCNVEAAIGTSRRNDNITVGAEATAETT